MDLLVYDLSLTVASIDADPWRKYHDVRCDRASVPLHELPSPDPGQTCHAKMCPSHGRNRCEENIAIAISRGFGALGYFGGGLGGNKDLQEPFLRAHLTAALAKGEGEIHVGELPEVGVVGVTLWFGPGHKFLDSDAQREAGWNQIMEKLSPECREWWDIFLSQYDALVERSQGAGVKLGGYHLQVIGTSPEHQKKGVGRALIDYVEKKAHAIKVPTCLETVGETNLAIYKSMNFEVAGSGPIKAPPPYPGDMEMYVFVKHTERDTY